MHIIKVVSLLLFVTVVTSFPNFVFAEMKPLICKDEMTIKDITTGYVGTPNSDIICESNQLKINLYGVFTAPKSPSFTRPTLGFIEQYLSAAEGLILKNFQGNPNLLSVSYIKNGIEVDRGPYGVKFYIYTDKINYVVIRCEKKSKDYCVSYIDLNKSVPTHIRDLHLSIRLRHHISHIPLFSKFYDTAMEVVKSTNFITFLKCKQQKYICTGINHNN